MGLGRRYRAVVVCAGVAVIAAASPAAAQAPGYPPTPFVAPVAPASPQAGEIAACLCLEREIAALNADWNAKQQAYNAARDEVTRLDAQLQSARATMDVNNPQSVAQFRQLLEQRDAAFKRSTGLVAGDLSSTIARYNARVSEYNSRCANRPRDPVLLRQVQASLTCPPAY